MEAVVDGRVVLELLVGVHAVDAGAPHRGSGGNTVLFPAEFGYFLVVEG